jgi:hypothetical protein
MAGYVGDAPGGNGGGTPSAVLSFRQFGERIPSPNSNTVMDDTGLMTSSDHVHTTAATNSESPGGLYFQQNGNVAVHTGIDNGNLAETGHVFPDNLPTYRAVFMIESTGGDPGIRLFAGLSDNANVAAATASNDPTDKYVALQFADDRDTNFQVAHRDTSQTLVDTGVAFAYDTIYAVEVAFTSATTATVKLWDTLDAGPAATVNITTQLPPSGTLLGDVISTVNDFAPFVNHTVRHYLQRIWTKSLFSES